MALCWLRWSTCTGSSEACVCGLSHAVVGCYTAATGTRQPKLRLHGSAAPIPVVLGRLNGRDGRVEPEPPIRRPSELTFCDGEDHGPTAPRRRRRRIGARSGLDAAILTLIIGGDGTGVRPLACGASSHRSTAVLNLRRRGRTKHRARSECMPGRRWTVHRTGAKVGSNTWATHTFSLKGRDAR